ncbi:MAG: glycosyltransferase [candidate division Zixibacteria bacterium]|nr:glycosyltransferase [candidate division Zixibacteria bacterium]
MTLWFVFESLVLAGWSGMALYGLLLTLVGWIARRREAPLIFPRHTFALLVPANGDEEGLADTLEHLRQVKYPRGMFDVILAPVNDTEQTATIARQKGVVLYGPGKRCWHNREEAIHSSLERLASKSRYDAFVILDAAVRVSPDYLAVLSDKLSKGCLIVQSGYQTAGHGPFWKTGVRAVLSALSPSWLTGWSGRFRLGSGLRHAGVCFSRRVVEKYGLQDFSTTAPCNYTLRLLREDVVVSFAPAAMLYDGNPNSPVAPHSAIERLSAWGRRLRHDALPLILEGMTWKSAAQVMGGVSLVMPSFSWAFSGASIFTCLALFVHGADHPLTLGWLVVLTTLTLVVVLRLTQHRAPIAVGVIPAFPPTSSTGSRHNGSSTPIAASIPETPSKNNTSRRRNTPRRNRQTPSLGKEELSDPA